MFGDRCVGGTVIKVNKADKVLWILRTNLTRTMLHSINPPPQPFWWLCVSMVRFNTKQYSTYIPRMIYL